MLRYDMAEAKPRTSHFYILDRFNPLFFFSQPFQCRYHESFILTSPSGAYCSPMELAMLIHNYDRQRELQQNQLTYLQQAQNTLRRAAPVISELLDSIGLNVPNYEYIHEPRELLTQIHQRLTEEERIVNEGVQPPPSPYIPNDDSRSAPAKFQRVTKNYLADQPWPHVDPQDYTVFQAWRTAARVFLQADEALDIPDTAP